MFDDDRPSPLRYELTYTLASCPTCLGFRVSLVFDTADDTFYRCATCDTVWFTARPRTPSRRKGRSAPPDSIDR